MDGRSLAEDKVHIGTQRGSTSGRRSRVTIDILPDLVLLEIFDFYMDENRIQAWQTLVHVCRNWRIIVLSSPRRLNLRLLCPPETSINEFLDDWPPLPLFVWNVDHLTALKHCDRIGQVDLDFPNSQCEEVLEAMRRPFPALTSLKLDPTYWTAPVDPDSFLGGSAPRLQTLRLYRVPFPGLPKLLLSATQLVYLDLWFIPHSGYISPEAMVTCLSTLTRLETLEIGFEDPQSRPDPNSQRPPLHTLHTHTHLPALTKFCFQGVGEYMEDLVARIDTPLLEDLTVTFIHQVLSSSPQLIQFIDRTPRLQPHNQACIIFEPEEDVSITLPQSSGGELRLQIKCGPSDQLLSLARLCSSSIPRALISAVERLFIVEGADLRFEGEIEDSPVQWVELLCPFTGVECLYISWEYTSHLVLALQELAEEEVTEVLPNLQRFFFEESEEIPSSAVEEAVMQVGAARIFLGQPLIFPSEWLKGRV